VSIDRSRSRRWWRVLVEWTAIVAITCLVGEGVARLLGERPLTSGSLLWRHHPRWGWQMEPNADDLFVKLGFEQKIHINSRGLREREIPYQKSPDRLRILVIGDSAVVGFEVAEQERYTAVAERILNERGMRVEVINAGTRGWGTDQSLLFLLDEGLRYRPDVVLYQWTANDPYDNATIHRPFRIYGKPWFTVGSDGRPELRGVPVPNYAYRSNLRVGENGEPIELEVGLRSSLLLWVRDVFVCHSAFASWLTRLAVSVPSFTGSLNAASTYNDTTDRPADMGQQSHVARVTAALIREMERASREAGARFAVVAAESGLGAEAREAAGLPDLGDLQRLRDLTPKGAQLQVENDPHWNALGHRLYGEALAKSLLAAGLVQSPTTDPGAAAPGATFPPN
jgi:hypothetical protein